MLKEQPKRLVSAAAQGGVKAIIKYVNNKLNRDVVPEFAVSSKATYLMHQEKSVSRIIKENSRAKSTLKKTRIAFPAKTKNTSPHPYYQNT